MSEHLKNVRFDPSHSKILLTCGVSDGRERFTEFLKLNAASLQITA
ncbi:hypothetical protein [Leptospira interrogans]|nr:hypothetical protein [Leptospira interrogans]